VRVLLLVNSTASSVTARGRVVIGKALSADHDVTVAETSRRGHATRLAHAAASEGVDVVVVLGGDGTLNEAANGLAGSRTALAPLPGGSTNVFARTIGMPDDPIEACGVLLDALAADSIRRVGLGVVNDRYFLFHVGLGFDAAVVQQVERRGDLKRWMSHALFAYCAFLTWFAHFDRSRPRFAVTHRDGTTVDDGYFAIAMNSNPYTYLGTRPFDVIPEATLDRGLGLVTLRSLDALTLLGVVGSALGRRRFLQRSRKVDLRTDLDGFSVRGHGPFPYQVDGDYLGEVELLELSHEPDALSLVVPPGTRW
jgi:diacylglycerol kinase family enzyme